ncbi:MAG TPA: phosphoribosylanthranilate isomerase [Pyrinomonadaceae bacterium]
MALIKVCGITGAADAAAAVAAGAGALGFNFYARSPRCVAPAAARAIIAGLPQEVLAVGVFVNEASPTEVVRKAEAAGVGAVQLHGEESPEFCAAVSELACVPVIKALRVGADFTPAAAARYERAHAVLLDAYSPHAHGGTGHVFDWTLARRTRELVARLYLAGGLTAENVAAAVAAVRPFAVDVCSGVEAAPGRKDAARLRAFCAAVRAADSL